MLEANVEALVLSNLTNYESGTKYALDSIKCTILQVDYFEFVLKICTIIFENFKTFYLTLKLCFPI